jgi:hypothetical protein
MVRIKRSRPNVRCRPTNLSSVALGLAFFALITLPSLGIAFGAESMAAGLAFSIMLSVFLSLGLYFRPIKAKNILAVIITINAILLYVGIISLFSYFVNDTFNDVRFVQTFLFLLFFIFGALNGSFLFERMTIYQFDFAIKFVFYVLLLICFVSLTGFSPFFDYAHKPVVFYMEPSHFSANFSPFLLYMAITSQTRMRIFLLALTILLALSFQNLTLLVCALMVAVFTLRLHQIFLGFVAVTVFLVLGFEEIDASYYTSRLDLSRDSDNLSLLVFKSGWERAYLNFVNTGGLGIGFQQLGFIGDQGESMARLERMGANGLNLKDGGNVGTKLISEFGWLAVIGLFSYLFYFGKFVKKLRGISLGRVVNVNNSKQVFFLCCIVMYFIELFLRGTGYFTSSALLFVTSIIWLSYARKVSHGNI